MYTGKSRYLEKLTSKLKFKSVEVGENLDGSSPPSVFVGKYGYPKVYVGPMMSVQKDSSILDVPEKWIGKVRTNHDLVNLRLQLVRGKNLQGIKDDNSFLNKMRDITLAKSSVGVEATFKKKPTGRFINEDVQPFGPSGDVQKIETDNPKYHPQLEKAYYDTDLKAKDAVLDLNNKRILFSQIQKALSVGAFGRKRARKLVPTRWSITAVDSTISDAAIQELKSYSPIETFRVYHFASFKNHYSILMAPNAWQYEFIEAFIRVMGDEELMFSDHESNFKKKSYASIGGCYYSARLGVAEQLRKEKKQASVIIFREAYPGYIPLGVWNVRENVRKAMQETPIEFETLDEALAHVNAKLYLPLYKWRQKSKVLKNIQQQRTIWSYQ